MVVSAINRMMNRMKDKWTQEPSADQKVEALIELIKAKAQNLFVTRQFQCAQAVLCSLNEGLRGGLRRDAAARLASGLAEGLGGSGCLCGALSGGVLALGLFMGKSGRALLNASGSCFSTALLHRDFTERFGSTCCKVLSKKVKHDRNAHFEQCAEMTGAVAEIASRIIIESRPHLAKTADFDYLMTKDPMITRVLNRILPGIVGHCPA
jgi:C_GCAxxG_C_C family probable redox protein